MANPTYRNYLQTLVDAGGGLPAQEAQALLHVVGDDQRVNDHFVSDPYGYTGNQAGHVYANNTGYGPQGVSRLNEKYSTLYNTKYSPGQFGGAVSSGPAAPAAPTYDPNDLAFLDYQSGRLNSARGRTDAALNQGLEELLGSYNREASGANQRRSRALEDYAIQERDTRSNRDEALGKVDTNARTLAESLRRKLGLASGSDSSAYRQVAPSAVARVAADERGEVLEDYGTNFRNLDIAKKRAAQDFDALLASLGEQRGQRERNLRQGVEEQRIGIAESLADLAAERNRLVGGGYGGFRAAVAPYESEIGNRERTIDDLFKQFRTAYNVMPVNPQPVNLEDYMVDRQSINADRAMGPSEESPYAQLLRRRIEEETV